MTRLFFVALLLVVASPVFAPVAAQDVTNATTAPTSTPEPDCAEYIDSRTKLCNAELKNGTIHLTLLSDGDQRVTLTDAGGAWERGPINQKIAVLEDDEPTTATIEATTVDGRAGVTIQTSNELYAVPVRADTTLIGGPWSAADVQTGAATGAVATTVMVLVLAWRKLSGRSDEPRQIA